MKSRKGRASGGKVDEAGGNPAVFDDLKRKKGGRVEKKEKDGGEMKGGKARFRMDRPGRKQGGRVGANTSPLSTAHDGVSGAPGSPDPNG